MPDATALTGGNAMTKTRGCRSWRKTGLASSLAASFVLSAAIVSLPVGSAGAAGPSVSVAPSTSQRNAYVTVTLTGFRTGEAVKVKYKTGLATPASVVLCTITATTSTSICHARIPEAPTAGPNGNHRIVAKGSVSGRKASTTFMLVSCTPDAFDPNNSKASAHDLGYQDNGPTANNVSAILCPTETGGDWFTEIATSGITFLANDIDATITTAANAEPLTLTFITDKTTVSVTTGSDGSASLSSSDIGGSYTGNSRIWIEVSDGGSGLPVEQSYTVSWTL